ncbi:MAG: DUF1353 domain-containing protein [Bdellovibrionales bacterium]|nr:DUF1353 domain-containing protein [Massilia sp.]
MSNGRFSGNPKTEWLSDKGDDRVMRVIAPFWYLDPDGRRWDVPAGTIINGASIPRTLWSSVGSPYTGDYRRAALVHDAAVGREGVLRQEADTMFHFACLCGGCSMLQAKLLYAGVRVGTWASGNHLLAMDAVAIAPGSARLPGQQTPRELELRARYTIIANELMATSDNFADIRQVVDRHLGVPPGA